MTKYVIDGSSYGTAHLYEVVKETEKTVTVNDKTWRGRHRRINKHDYMVIFEATEEEAQARVARASAIWAEYSVAARAAEEEACNRRRERREAYLAAMRGD